MKAYIIGLLILFSPFAMAEDPIYTGFFSNKAVSGYDTVAYFTDHQPVKGKSQFKTSYMGADWYFASAEHLNMFTSNPEKYAPQYGGYCAWAVAAVNDFAPGDPELWAVVNDKLYLNYNKEVKRRWDNDRENLIKEGDKNWPALLSQK
ncbi:YHS domain-containing (seleno)protein [Vibrio mangrovi]|uniref:YHS domain protein n=1 Tax=Vibrio mangrovi TaxID=474394 RepID=A0A1Y6ITU6_9VIBR|nr:YHS domain-containing (seleno)protein [Vibrio mangrovi]MDW6004755.1 YHS domain-containing (seleno)protein [Vibrio mangrovi]SMS01046.1 YHS domain protein [Vibrio mangrovi]